MREPANLLTPVLGLGTVQFGQAYGISNTIGITPQEEVSRILNLAISRGLCYLDTARAYKKSEDVLGQSIANHSHFKIVTKIPPLPNTNNIRSFLDDSFSESLQLLRTDSVYGLILHQSSDYFGPHAKQIHDFFDQMKKDGRISKFGVSSYCYADILRAQDAKPMSLIQVPMNVFDQRLLSNDKIAKIKDQGVEVHARSAFLQGLLFSKPEQLPGFFAPARHALSNLHHTSLNFGVPIAQLALDFMRHQKIDVIICGVNTINQFEELLKYFQRKPVQNIDWSQFSINEEQILNPSQWPRT